MYLFDNQCYILTLVRILKERCTMKQNEVYKLEFPVGYYKFHKKQLYNFQLNRWHSFGFLPFDELTEVGKKISDFKSWKTEMKKLAENSLEQNNLLKASFYYRAAEFYTFPNDNEKSLLYKTFSELFYQCFVNDNIEKVIIPYEKSFLHAIRLTPSNQKCKGTILLHGGFDSFIEEFYSMIKYFAENGFEVIGFDGPGQGAALNNFNVAFDYQWEKPIKAVLDHLKLDNITLIGLSMGGWLSLRASAFEKRIKRVISSGGAYDYYKIPPAIARCLMDFFNNKLKKYTNKIAKKNIEKGGMDGWKMSNLMHMTKIDVPMTAFDYAMEMNEINLHAELIKQDVLILTSRNDHFIPFKLHDRQIKILKNANSLSDRIFTKNEQAHNHCQIGNIGLALNTMTNWINEKIID